MLCSQAILSLFLLAPCEESAGGLESIQEALSGSGRPAEDRQRDADRKPADVLAFLGLQPGQDVLEVFAGGGYYTQILDALVGPSGHLIAQTNDAYQAFVGPRFNGRFEDGGLPNTERRVVELNDLQLADGSLDAALLVLTWHDFLYGDERFNWQDVDEDALLKTLCRALRPGAVLGVIDHVADPGGDAVEIAENLHRIDPGAVRRDIGASCFRLKAESDLLANPDDDHTTSATEGPFKGRTDRFVMKFVRE